MSMAQTGNSSRFAPAPTTSNATAAAAQKAQEIAAKLSMTLTGQSSSGGGQAWPISGGGSNSVTMDIPVEKVGLVIGKAGSMIREIQETSGARLQLDSTGEPTRQLRISGFGQSVEIAKARVEGLMTQPTFGARVWRPTKTLQIPCECVGFVIGKGGETIKRISQETSCRMQVEDDDEAKRLGHTAPLPGHQNLHLIGSSEAVSSAEVAVMDLLQRKQGGGGSYNPTQQQVSQLRAQPYPAYAPPQGYAQVAQQAYALPAQGYAPNQMHGYGAYTPQYASYAPQTAQLQPAPGYPPSYTAATQQTYSQYPSQSQQPPTGAQFAGHMQNFQQPTQTYQPNSQQPPAGVIPYGHSGIQNDQVANSGNAGPNFQQTAVSGIAPNSQKTPTTSMPLNPQHMNPSMPTGNGMPKINQYGQMGFQPQTSPSSQDTQSLKLDQQVYPGAHQYQQPTTAN